MKIKNGPQIETFHRRGDHWIRKIDGEIQTGSNGNAQRYATDHPPALRWASCTHHGADVETMGRCCWCGAPAVQVLRQRADEKMQAVSTTKASDHDHHPTP